MKALGLWVALTGAPHANAAATATAQVYPDPPEAGAVRVELTLTDTGGKPADDATLTPQVFMPAMGAMPRMEQKATVVPKGGGRYELSFDLSMNGTWQLVIPVKDKERTQLLTGSLTTGIRGLALSAETSATGDAATLALPPARTQLIGVRFAEVTARPLTRMIRAAGVVEPDSSKRSEVALHFSGYVEKQLRGRIGDEVKAGAPLVTVYSPDVVAAENEFLLAHAGAEAGGSVAAALHQSTSERLRNFGLTAADLARIRGRGEPERTLTVVAPISGTILDITVREGASFGQGQALYTIGDLRKSYIVGRVFQRDLLDLKGGQNVTIVDTEASGRAVPGRVDLIYANANAADGTGNVRVVPLAPLAALKAGLLVDLRFPVALGERLTVPTTAILYSGLHRYVFVDKGEGRLEPREIQTGASVDDLTEVLSGLKDKERVAASGTFLLSAEAQLRSALPKWTNP